MPPLPHTPSFFASTSPPTPPGPPSLSTLPVELIFSILESAPFSIHELASLSATCTNIHRIVDPILYSRDMEAHRWSLFWAAHEGHVGTIEKALTSRSSSGPGRRGSEDEMTIMRLFGGMRMGIMGRGPESRPGSGEISTSSNVGHTGGMGPGPRYPWDSHLEYDDVKSSHSWDGSQGSGRGKRGCDKDVLGMNKRFKIGTQHVLDTAADPSVPCFFERGGLKRGLREEDGRPAQWDGKKMGMWNGERLVRNGKVRDIPRGLRWDKVRYELFKASSSFPTTTTTYNQSPRLELEDWILGTAQSDRHDSRRQQDHGDDRAADDDEDEDCDKCPFYRWDHIISFLDHRREIRGKDCCSPLHLAARAGHNDAVRALLRHGASVYATSQGMGESLSMEAGWSSEAAQVAWTPIHLALFHGHRSTAWVLAEAEVQLDKALDARGVSRNCSSEKGREGGKGPHPTGIHAAAFAGDDELVEYFLRAGKQGCNDSAAVGNCTGQGDCSSSSHDGVMEENQQSKASAMVVPMTDILSDMHLHRPNDDSPSKYPSPPSTSLTYATLGHKWHIIKLLLSYGYSLNTEAEGYRLVSTTILSNSTNGDRPEKLEPEIALRLLDFGVKVPTPPPLFPPPPSTANQQHDPELDQHSPQNNYHHHQQRQGSGSGNRDLTRWLARDALESSLYVHPHTPHPPAPNIALVRALLASGASPTSPFIIPTFNIIPSLPNTSHSLPLPYAIAFSVPEIITLLLEAGARLEGVERGILHDVFHVCTVRWLAFEKGFPVGGTDGVGGIGKMGGEEGVGGVGSVRRKGDGWSVLHCLAARPDDLGPSSRADGGDLVNVCGELVRRGGIDPREFVRVDRSEMEGGGGSRTGAATGPTRMRWGIKTGGLVEVCYRKRRTGNRNREVVVGANAMALAVSSCLDEKLGLLTVLSRAVVGEDGSTTSNSLAQKEKKPNITTVKKSMSRPARALYVASLFEAITDMISWTSLHNLLPNPTRRDHHLIQLLNFVFTNEDTEHWMATEPRFLFRAISMQMFSLASLMVQEFDIDVASMRDQYGRGLLVSLCSTREGNSDYGDALELAKTLLRLGVDVDGFGDYDGDSISCSQSSGGDNDGEAERKGKRNGKGKGTGMGKRGNYKGMPWFYRVDDDGNEENDDDHDDNDETDAGDGDIAGTSKGSIWGSTGPMTPLMTLAHNDHFGEKRVALMQLLLESGADSRRRNREGLSAVDLVGWGRTRTPSDRQVLRLLETDEYDGLPDIGC